MDEIIDLVGQIQYECEIVQLIWNIPGKLYLIWNPLEDICVVAQKIADFCEESKPNKHE